MLLRTTFTDGTQNFNILGNEFLLILNKDSQHYKDCVEEVYGKSQATPESNYGFVASIGAHKITLPLYKDFKNILFGDDGQVFQELLPTTN